MSFSDLPLAVVAQGPPPSPGRPTFVLLHGYGGSSYSWRFWAPRLARRGHVLSVDLKGFGAAPKPRDDRYAPADLTELVLRLIRERGLTGVTLVGHSLGGGVALHAALALAGTDEEARVGRLVLVGSAAYPQRLPPFVSLARHPRIAQAAVSLLGPRLIVGQALRFIVFDNTTIDGEQIRAYAEPLRSPGAVPAYLEVARRIVPDDLVELTREYPRVRVPTLLLWGRHDPAVPLWVGRRLRGALPHSTLRIVERCGHLVPEERPDASWAILEAFLDATDPSSPC